MLLTEKKTQGHNTQDVQQYTRSLEVQISDLRDQLDSLQDELQVNQKEKNEQARIIHDLRDDLQKHDI